MNFIRNICLLLVSLIMAISASAQYNPSSPPEPGQPDTRPTYLLTVDRVPAGGAVNVSSARYLAGASVNLVVTSIGSSYTFVGWEDEEGNILESSKRYTFVMPANDLKLTARFKYTPASPDEPPVPPKYGQVNLSVNPSGAGSVSGGGSYLVGSSVRLIANVYSDFTFKDFTRDGEVLSTSGSFYYVVREGTNNIVANYRYTPGSPGEPASPSVDRNYTVSFAATNSGGYCSPSSASGVAGSMVSVTAHAYSDYSFVNWTDESGAVLSNSQTFSYVIPERDSRVTANFRYTPYNPEEPGSVSPRRNVIYGSRVSCRPGSDVMYDIMLENIDQVSGITVDVAMPDGFVADYNNIRLGSRASSLTLESQPVDERTVRISARGTSAIDGGNGAVIRLPVHIPADVTDGSSFDVELSKGVVYLVSGSQSPVDAGDGIIKIAEAEISLPDSPDFIIENLEAARADVMPGDRISVSWKVVNKGSVPANGGWNETIWLVSKDGKRKSLGTVYYDTDMVAVGESVVREVELAVPSLPGMDGECDVMIVLVPYASSGEIEQLQVNNSQTTDNQPIVLGKILTLELPASLTEGKDGVIRGRLLRSGDWNSTEEFAMMMTKGDKRLIFPENIRIVKDQSGAYFQMMLADNDKLDDSSEFEFSVSGNGYPEVAAAVEVIDDEFPEIEISLDDESVTEGESTTMTLTLAKPTETDLKISLSCDAPARFRFPQEVTVPAGSSSVRVEIETVDNDKIENRLDVSFYASAPHYVKGEAWIYLNDNDMPVLELELSPVEVSEGAGQKAIRGVLRRTTNRDIQATVLLSDNAPGMLSYDKKLTLAKGIDQVDFNIGVIDNSIVDGDRTVRVNAAVFVQTCSCSAGTESGGSVTSEIRIVDNDGPSLQLSLSNATLRKDARATTLTVKRNTSTRDPLTVSLSADPDDVLNLPAEVVIPIGAESTKVNIEAPLTAFVGVEKTVVLNASANGFSKGTSILLVSDKTLPDATVSVEADFSAEFVPGQKIPVRTVVTNAGNAVMPDAAAVDLYIDGVNGTVASGHTTRKLSAGESETLDMTVAAPEVPGTYTLTAYVNGVAAFAELTMTNNTSEKYNIVVKSPFVPTVNVDRHSLLPGENLLISGEAKGYGKALELYFIMNGARRTFSVTPDAQGRFSYDFGAEYPGDYKVGVCIPGENKSEAMDEFSVLGIHTENNAYLTYDLEAGSSKSQTFRIINSSSVPLTGVRIVAENVPDNCGVEFPEVEALGGNSSVAVSVRLTGLGLTEGNDWQQMRLRVTSDEGPELVKTLYFYCRPNRARLVSSVGSINTTMTVGESRTYRFSIGNNGSGESGEITLSLPSFMQNGTATTLPSIAAGTSQYVDLVLTPSPEMQLNVPVHGTIGIGCANGDGIALPFTVEPVSDQTGHLVVDVKDEYTFYTAEAPHVAGADVIVSHPVTGRMIAHGKTDDNGVWSVELPEGYYVLEVAADRHGSYKESFLLDPGVDNNHPVFLPFEAITYSWNVEETTVDDEYEIVTVVDFETRVPKPVVLVEFPEIKYRNQIVYVTVTNKGLITATNVEVIVPEADNEHVSMRVIGDCLIPELMPGETRQIPVMVTVDQEGAYPDFKMTVSSYTISGDVAGGDDSRANARRRANSSSGCIAVPCKVLVDDPECDPLTGEPIYGRKKEVDSNYYTGDCNPYTLPSGLGSPDLSGWGGGWGGSPGSGGGPGSPGSPDNSTPVSTYWQDRVRTILMTGCMNDCEKALADMLKACYDAVKGCTGTDEDEFNPVECAKNVADSCNPDKIQSWHDSVSCGTTGAGCVPALGCPAGIAECINQAIKVFEECYKLYKHRKDNGEIKSRRRNDGSTDSTDDEDEILDAKEKRARTVISYYRYYDLIRSNIHNVIGDMSLSRVSRSEFSEMLRYVTEHCDENGYTLTGQKALEGKPAGLDIDSYYRFLERYNNSVRYEMTGEKSDNMADFDLMSSIAGEAAELKSEILGLGYPDMQAFAVQASEDLKAYDKMSEEPASGVCASITLKFTQTLVMTRQAFRGTLSVTNGNEEVAMTDVALRVKVRDSEGNLVGSREFAVRSESLTGFEGENTLGEPWRLGAGATGEVNILFIPSKYAAPVEPSVYSFGGQLSYIDPFSGTEVTRELEPIEMTVSPSPELDLDYFMQRDVIGDDPLTEKVEASVPAEFALLIRNHGFGTASNLRMVTSQPVIESNTRGLAIDFRITGSSLNGLPRTMSIGERIPTDFGDLEAGATTYAQWWLTSSLMGHFREYDVKATQLSAYGSEDMSLLENVLIHELIHGMTPPDGGVNSRAFLVNDTEDAANLPDMLWMSDTGEALEVAVNERVSVSEVEDESCILNVGEGSGWNYGVVDAPWTNTRRVTGVVRLSDNTELPADNVWISNVTMVNSSAPKHESKVHCALLLDGKAGSYRLTLESVPDMELEVVEISGVPGEGDMALKPVEEVTVTFNKPVDGTSFDISDMTMTCAGKRVSLDTVSIEPAADIETAEALSADTDTAVDVNRGVKSFIVKFNGVTSESGFYSLTVNANGIIDADGYNGSTSGVAAWSQLADGKVTVSCVALPAEGGTVGFGSKKVEYGNDVDVTASANDGYTFTKWTIDGDYASDKASFSVSPKKNMDLVANFSVRDYNVDLECDPEQGTLVGAGSGIYRHGYNLNVEAVPQPGFNFVKWIDGDGEDVSDNPVLVWKVDSDRTFEALFKSTETGVDINQDSPDIRVYPTAVRDRMYVDGNFDTLRSLSVISANGSKCRSISGCAKGSSVNMSTLVQGVYIVKVITDKGVSTHRIVKL